MSHRLDSLAKVAAELNDDGLNDVMLYVACLKIRARLFGLISIADQLERVAGSRAYCRCKEPALAKYNGLALCVLCLLHPPP